MDTLVENYQRELLEQAKVTNYETPISEATQKAFLATPRHLFVKCFREFGIKAWREINDDNLTEHLVKLYMDRPLIIFGEDDENVPSTISEPSFVLRMLDMLQIEPGHIVLELGAGSGWNAVLMGYLVGSQGQVNSIEIIPEVAQMANQIIVEQAIRNVRIIEADGGEGYAPDAPYDRAIFTAGTYDLPQHFFEQMKENSLLLIVIKNEGGGDTLFLLQKRGEYFESLESVPCGFVPMKGKYQIDNLGPINLETLLEWPGLKDQEISKRPFWWGGNGKNWFQCGTTGIRSFLSITEPTFRTFKTDKTTEKLREEHYFGLWDEASSSLVIAKDAYLTSYGNAKAEERLMHRVRQWVELGMPGASSFSLKIYPLDYPLARSENQWIIKRNESQFLWSLVI